jgi:hypothetical protein
MKLQILDRAENDLVAGYRFYEDRELGMGQHFLQELYSDIESLRLYAGIHRRACRDFHRLLSRRFPFAVFYKVAGDTVYEIDDGYKDAGPTGLDISDRQAI